jgi:hypothetical protein
MQIQPIAVRQAVPSVASLHKNRYVTLLVRLACLILPTLRRQATRQNPVLLSDEYSIKPRQIAFERAAMAGHRLEEFLKQSVRRRLSPTLGVHRPQLSRLPNQIKVAGWVSQLWPLSAFPVSSSDPKRAANGAFGRNQHYLRTRNSGPV